MSGDDHRRLLEAAVGVRGMVILSGYAHPLYDEALRDWERLEFPMACHAGQGRAKWRRSC